MGAYAPHKTDTTDAAWDNAQMRKNTRSGEDEAYYRQIFAWLDPDKTQDTLDAHSFIHHMVSADGTPGAANVTALQTAIGVLNGGRLQPGDDTPWMKDRQGIYDHLAAHLRDANLEPPELQDEVSAIDHPPIDSEMVQRVTAIRSRRLKAVTASLGETRTGRPWYRIENVATGMADISIFGRIGGEFGITAGDFAIAVRDLDVREITLHLHSPGGDPLEAIAIYNALRSNPAKVTVRVEGLAASAASIVAMGGNRVVMANHAMMMIHDAKIGLRGEFSAQELGDLLRVVDPISETIAAIYRDRGDSRINWRQKMQAETWYSDTQAVTAGLADEVDRSTPAVKNDFDLSIYDHVPAELSTDEGGAMADQQSHATVIHNHGTINMVTDKPVTNVAPSPSPEPDPDSPAPEPKPDPEPEPAAMSEEPSEVNDQEPTFTLADAQLLTEVATELARV